MKINSSLDSVFVALVVALGGFLLGFDGVVNGGAVPFYRVTFGISDIPVLIGLSSSAIILGVIFGNFSVGFIIDKIGRKPALLITSILFMVGAGGTAISTSIGMFIFCKLVAGLGLGITILVAPMYIAEIAPPKQRGRFTIPARAYTMIQRSMLSMWQLPILFISKILKAGKAVLCEKPISVKPDELEALLNVAKSTGKYFMEGMWTYFLPAIQMAQRWVKEGRIGAIKQVKSDFGYKVPFDPESRMHNFDLAGGSLFDMGIYTIAMAWLFYKKDPKNVTVISRNSTTGVDNDVTTLFEYDNALATLNSAFRCKLNNWTYVIGKDGYIAIPDFWRAREFLLYEGEDCIQHYIDKRKGFGFNFEIDSVSNDLLTGKKSSGTMPHAYSLKFQEHLYRVASKF